MIIKTKNDFEEFFSTSFSDFIPSNKSSILTDGNLKKQSEKLQMGDAQFLFERNKSYYDIIKEYTGHLSASLKSKRVMKIIFFIISAIIMVLSVIFLIIFCIYTFIRYQKDDIFNIREYIAILLPAISSFLTVFIIIPKIIAKYLFNSKEDNVMREIISDIQQYDKFIRENNFKSFSKDTIEDTENNYVPEE